MDKAFGLTKTDNTAIRSGDAAFINRKGADLYVGGEYKKAVEYYRLAAAMGNVDSISNLGYCYLYGRSVEKNTELAMSYFTIACRMGSADGAYKLGDIYGSDKYVSRDEELSVYYYRLAVGYILGADWESDADLVSSIMYDEELVAYPSLCFALGREYSKKEGMIDRDLYVALAFLRKGKEGYERELRAGKNMYSKVYKDLCALLEETETEDLVDSFDEDELEY